MQSFTQRSLDKAVVHLTCFVVAVNNVPVAGAVAGITVTDAKPHINVIRDHVAVASLILGAVPSH